MGRTFSLDLRPGWLILLSLSLLLLPLRWLGAILIGQIFHEFCHLFVLRLIRSDVLDFRAGAFGAIISTSPLTQLQELLCAVAGPVGSLLLTAFIGSYPELALCGLIQGIYNLLPVYPSDGGRILRCITELCYPKYTRTVMTTAAYLTVLTILAAAAGLAILFPRWIYALITAVFGMLWSVIRKYSCKDSAIEVQ